jgi:hypothetical protein
MISILWVIWQVSHLLIGMSLFIGHAGVAGSKYLLVGVKSKGVPGGVKSKL